MTGGGLLASVAVGYLYATTELLQPPDAASMRVASKLGHGILALFVAHGLSAILYGPGRVPVQKRGQGWQPPPALEAALEVGRYAKHKTFRGAEEWCFDCNRWKPPLAHHCSVCNRCSLWMDHHCNLLGQCVGFRNLRCFICFLATAQLLIAFLLVLSLLRVLLSASFDLWVFGRVVLFDAALAYALKVSNSHFRFVLLKLSLGWPSGVLHTKFTGVAEYAQEIIHVYGGMPSSSMQELQAAYQQVLRPSGGLRGLFEAKGLLGNLAVAFGEPPSWRWLLPLRPGGPGDPVRPKAFCEETCQAWAALGDALTAHHEVMAQVQRLMALRQQVVGQDAEQWSSRMEALAARGASTEDAFAP